jgi:hypothetical protein
LESSFITREIAESAGLRRVSDLEARSLLGIDGRRGDFAGIVIPHFDPRDRAIPAYRLRRDHPDLEERDGRVVERAKYLSERNARNCLYFLPWTEPSWLDDETLPILLS